MEVRFVSIDARASTFCWLQNLFGHCKTWVCLPCPRTTHTFVFGKNNPHFCVWNLLFSGCEHETFRPVAKVYETARHMPIFGGRQRLSKHVLH